MRENQTCLESLAGAMDANEIVAAAAVAAAWMIASCLGILTLAAVLDSSLAMALSHMPSLDLVDLRVEDQQGGTHNDEHPLFLWLVVLLLREKRKERETRRRARTGRGEKGPYPLSSCACSLSPRPLLKKKGRGARRRDASGGWITYSSQRSHVYRWAYVLLLLALPRLVAAAAGDVVETAVAVVASAWLFGVDKRSQSVKSGPVSSNESSVRPCSFSVDVAAIAGGIGQERKERGSRSVPEGQISEGWDEEEESCDGRGRKE